jgi:hypothetical protein
LGAVATPQEKLGLSRFLGATHFAKHPRPPRLRPFEPEPKAPCGSGRSHAGRGSEAEGARSGKRVAPDPPEIGEAPRETNTIDAAQSV